MPKKSKLTPAEWEIMQAIWDLNRPVSVREVLEHLFPDGEKAYTTVQTVMNTLDNKKLLTRQKTGLVNFYKPTHSQEDLTRGEMNSMVSRVFGGSIRALANSLVSLEEVGLDELAEIRRLILLREQELKEADQ
jgi:BlaI family transcriptional regulator, penicillinase repressor